MGRMVHDVTTPRNDMLTLKRMMALNMARTL
jgi:hypothetical protein